MRNSRRKPESLKPYKTLYRGRRLWAVRNNPNTPLREWTKESEIVVWDASVESVVAVGNFKKDGTIAAEIVWGQGVSFLATDIKLMIAKVVLLEKQYL